VISKSIPMSVKVADGVIYQKIQDEVVLLNMENQQYYSLNPTASVFWDNIVEHQDIQAAEERLVVSFPDNRDEVGTDLRELVQKLIRAGLLKTLGPESSGI
jgi:hypothetical protein